jgi:glycosyltransferase AglD
MRLNLTRTGLDPLMGPPDDTAVSSDAGREAARLRRSRAIRGVFLVAFLGFASWMLRGLRAGHVWSALVVARPRWIVLASLINLAAVLLQAVRWLALIRPMSGVVTLGSAFKSAIVGMAVSMVVPARAGELARVQWLARRTGLPRASIFGSIVLDYLMNAAGMMLGLGLLSLFLPIPVWIRRGGSFVLLVFVIGALVVFVAHPDARQASRLSRWIPARIAGILARMRHGLTASRHPRSLSMSLGASLAAWALEIVVIVITLAAVGLRLPVSAAFLVLLAVNLALALPFAPPGNVGTLEVGAALALVGFGVPREQALAFGIVYHVLQVVPIGVLGLIFSGRAGRTPTAEATNSIGD